MKVSSSDLEERREREKPWGQKTELEEERTKKPCLALSKRSGSEREEIEESRGIEEWTHSTERDKFKWE